MARQNLQILWLSGFSYDPVEAFEPLVRKHLLSYMIKLSYVQKHMSTG